MELSELQSESTEAVARPGAFRLALVGLVPLLALLALATPVMQLATGSISSLLEPSTLRRGVQALMSAASPLALPMVDDQVLPAAPAPAEGAAKGDVRVGSFHSRALDREMPYAVYLPPGYASANRRYPTLYLLHGLGGSYETWLGFGIASATDDLIGRGAIPPMIIVMPQGDRGYWMNHADGGPRWGDYLVYDLVGFVDSTYRTMPDRSHRAIGGNSMGGHGALQTALNHPDLFGVVGAHSPGLRRQSEAFSFFGDLAYYAQHDPISLVENGAAAECLRIWIDTGAEDPWAKRADELHAALMVRGVAHEWHLFPGKHDAEYWSSHVADYLRFYGASLAQGQGS